MTTFDEKEPISKVTDVCFDGEAEITININEYNPPYQFPTKSFETIVVLKKGDEVYGVTMFERAITKEQTLNLLAEIKENPTKFKSA